MKEDFDLDSYFAGYPGKDSMREKAKRLMAEEFRSTKMTMPGSFSEPSREHMRLYKKGGPVHHKHRAHEEHHVSKLFPMHHHEESGMKRSAHHHHPETRQRAPRNIEGGSLTDLYVPTPRLNEESVRGVKMMHKGGEMHKHTHKKHHHIKRATGGEIKKFAAGGTVYEHEMVGEKPGMHKKINYEKDMKGMHPSRVPSMTGSHRKNPGADDQSFGSTFKRGGKACKKASGGPIKRAIGGVGKIRHEAANKKGLPKMAKRKMGY